MKKVTGKIIIAVLILFFVSILLSIFIRNKNGIVKTSETYTKKITKEEFLETLGEKNSLSLKQVEIEFEKSCLKNKNQHVKSQYYEMVDKILLMKEIYLVGIIRTQVYVDSDDNFLSFGEVVMKDLLVEGATLYQNKEDEKEKDFEIVIRQPENTLISIDVLSGVEFYSKKNLVGEKVETVKKEKGKNLYRYIVDDTFTYSLSELENEVF